jgi:hypothetical protein
MNKELNNSLDTSLKSLEPDLTVSLRKEAIDKGWPEELASYLNVRIKDKAILVSYEDAVADQIEDLEYGSKIEGPKPVLRFFASKNQEVIANKISEWSVNYLFEKGILP